MPDSCKSILCNSHSAQGALSDWRLFSCTAVSVSYCYVTNCPKLSVLKQSICIISEKSTGQLDGSSGLGWVPSHVCALLLVRLAALLILVGAHIFGGCLALGWPRMISVGMAHLHSMQCLILQCLTWVCSHAVAVAGL